MARLPLQHLVQTCLIHLDALDSFGRVIVKGSRIWVLEQGLQLLLCCCLPPQMHLHSHGKDTEKTSMSPAISGYSSELFRLIVPLDNYAWNPEIWSCLSTKSPYASSRRTNLLTRFSSPAGPDGMRWSVSWNCQLPRPPQKGRKNRAAGNHCWPLDPHIFQQWTHGSLRLHTKDLIQSGLSSGKHPSQLAKVYHDFFWGHHLGWSIWVWTQT